MARALRLGLVGCGAVVARRYAQLIAARTDVALRAVCTRSEPSARAGADRLGAPIATTDLVRLLGSGEVDAVVIASPHPFHAAQAIRALDAGVHVLVEKPLATTLTDAEAVRTAAARSRAVCLPLPHVPSGLIRAARAHLASDAFGRLVAATADFSGPGPAADQAWKFDAARAGGGILHAHAVYALDLVARLGGPASLLVALGNTLQAVRRDRAGAAVKSDIIDNAVVSLVQEGGRLASVRTNWSLGAPRQHVRFEGTRGALVYDAGTLYAEDGEGRRAIPTGPPEDVLDAFVGRIQTGLTDEAGLARAVHVVEQASAAEAVIRAGGGVARLTTRFDP